MNNIFVHKFGANLLRRFVAVSQPVASVGIIRWSPFSFNAGDSMKSHMNSSDSSGLTLTNSCVQHLKKFANSEEFLRISVEGGGCSGFSYKFELDKERGEDDLFFCRDGVEVVTDVDSFELIKGSKIDYETELIKSAFRIIDNPQSTTNCSCGVSFSIKL